MIEFEGVIHSFGEKRVLDGVSVTLREKRIAIVGANGSGKTTFARMMNALVLPDRGEVRVDGVATVSDARHARRTVGLVFQNADTQIVMPTVAEDLAFGLENMGLPKREIKRRVASILEAYGLGGMGERPAHLLSGGEKKLLSVLSVVIMEPKVIVLDEPFASLDMLNRERLRRLLNELPQMLITITHDLDTVLGYERAIWFDRGRIAADGAPGTVIPQYFKKTREWFQSISPETQAFTGFIPA